MTLQQPQQHWQQKQKQPLRSTSSNSLSSLTWLSPSSCSSSSSSSSSSNSNTINNNNNNNNNNLRSNINKINDNKSINITNYIYNNTNNIINSALCHHSNDITSSQDQSRSSLQARSDSNPTNAAEKNRILESSVSTTDTVTGSVSSPGNGHGHGSKDKDTNLNVTQESSDPITENNGASVSEPGLEARESGTGFTARCQDHLRLFFSMHHKLFDLVAFYVVMFAINGQMTSLPTRLEWIGFCVQSIIALRRAFQTSIKHGIGLTSFLGMLDLLVGQLFLHQDRLGLLPTVANILVYFYVINLTRGLVFGDSVSCLLWFLFGLVDIYRKDPSSASILDLTPYKVIPVHTVGFGLYILMSELVDVMLHSAEPDPIQGRYLHYMGSQKEAHVSIRRSTARSTDSPSNLRFELCITEITPFTISFCLNALSDSPTLGDLSAEQDSNLNKTSASTLMLAGATGGSTPLTEAVDLSTIKIGSVPNNSSRSSKAESSPRIISTSDIVIHVNYIPWHQVQYHFPDEQSFTIYGLTPSTDYEIEMRVHQYSSFVTRVGTRAAPPGTPIPSRIFEKASNPTESLPKNNKTRKSKKNQKAQKEPVDKSGETNKSKAIATTTTTTTPTSSSSFPLTASEAIATTVMPSTRSEPIQHASLTVDQSITPSSTEQKNSNQILLEQLQASIQSSAEAASATRAALKKLKRDQGKTEALLRQELEGIGRGQAKALVQDQKRKQKLSFLQESIKQADAHSLTLQEELKELRGSTLSSQPSLDEILQSIRTLEQNIQETQARIKAEVTPLKAECQRIQTEIKGLEGERLDWTSKATHVRENELAPLQLRLQRLEQQQVVWKVAAEASKVKDREANLKIAAFEEDIQKKSLKSRQLEDEIQELKTKNTLLKESVGQEMEIWESLEREPDDDVGDDEKQSPSFPLRPMSQSTAHDSHSWHPVPNGIGSGSDLWHNSSSPFTGGSAVPLPKLSASARVSAEQAQTSPESDMVMVERDGAATESEDDYDMLMDEGDTIQQTLPVSDLSISPSSTPENTTKPSTETASSRDTASSPFVDMLLKETESKSNEALAMTTTENGAPTYATTGDARLDFFFEVLHGTEANTIQRLVRNSWVVHPLDTLRLIFQLRSILHGKGERKEFYICLDFLREEHPKTLLYNLRFIPDHGYWKDLLNWLVFEVRGDHTNYSLTSTPPINPSSKSSNADTTSKQPKRGSRTSRPVHKRTKLASSGESATKQGNANGKPRTAEERQQAIDKAEERNHQHALKAREARIARDNDRLEQARVMFKDNSFYRSLHLEVARLFANALVRDKTRLQQGKSISLAAKWCPSLNQFHDSHTLIASTVAQILYPECRPEEDHVAYVNRVRQLLRQEYYVPLRKATPVLETMMAAQRWDEIVYSRVPAIAMKNNKGHFEANDKERFEQYLASISRGETTIAAQALMPHQLVTEARSLQDQGLGEDDLGVKTLEAQWKSYVERLAKSGTMDSTMAMCDVSGSMSGQPMEVAIALSLLLSQLSRPPFNRLVLTFSESPKIHRVPEGSLMQQVQSLRGMNWGMNTDLAKAFNHILTLSIKNKVANEDMVKTLFIFSDMEFDQAVRGAHQGEPFTNYATVKRQFEHAGYELPQIVFWNLRGSNVGNKPAKATQDRVAMVSGYSGMLMKLFLEGGDMAEALNPVRLMEKAIGTKEFSRLKVVD
ncbi:hypothetical protein BGX26_004188 [Mortierella sp. AD094]|nr:hypothetical protein BGX26_004188 [Mortierella sp. AD094]